MSAVATIVYNGKTITFPYLHFTEQVDSIRQILRNFSASGKSETLNVRADEIIAVGWRWFVNANSTDATLKRNLRQWFEWAQKGGSWKLALDSTKTVLTTLTTAATAGASSVIVTSATGIVAGDQYVIKSGTVQELVKVSSIAGAPTITLTESLNHAVAAGDRFRTEKYWPGMLLDSTNPLVEQPPVHYDFMLRFVEDMNS